MYNDDDKYIEPWVSYTREAERCDYNKKTGPLKMTFHEATNITFTSPYGEDYSLLMLSKNGGEWVSATNYSGTSLSVASGDTLEFRGDYDTYNPFGWHGGSQEDYQERVAMNTQYIDVLDDSHWPKVALEGNIMSLIDSENYSNIESFTEPHVFELLGLFRKISITDMSKLVLPVTGLTDYCYSGLFYRAEELHQSGAYHIFSFDEFATAPALPATTLAEGCYKEMFKNCWSLEIAPVLSAQTLVGDCYYAMFASCLNLHDVTILATSLDSSLSSVRECCMDMLAAGNADCAGLAYVDKHGGQCTFNCPNQTILADFSANYDSIGCTFDSRIWNIPE